MAYFQLDEFVLKVTSPATVRGDLLVRDGLPIIDPEGQRNTEGTLLTFHPDKAKAAYERISEMEPREHYVWKEVQIDQTPANVLFGRSPRKGSEDCPWMTNWDGWKDPLFVEALEVVEETHEEVSGSSDRYGQKSLFRLQMAYLLLWSSIERYLSLRHRLDAKVTAKINHLAEDRAFAESLQQHVKGKNNKRTIHRADRPQDKYVLDRTEPKKSAEYYYQVRSNVTHRGKSGASDRDYEILEWSLRELLAIFRDMLKVAQEDAKRMAAAALQRS